MNVCCMALFLFAGRWREVYFIWLVAGYASIHCVCTAYRLSVYTEFIQAEGGSLRLVRDGMEVMTER